MNVNFQRFFLIHPQQERKVWLDFHDYANKLFAQDAEDFWLNPMQYIFAVKQAQGMLRSDILSIPIIRFFENWLRIHPEALEKWKGKKPTFVCKKILTEEEPLQVLLEVTNGLKNLYPEQLPLVLVLSSPGQWLRLIQNHLSEEKATSFDSEAIESVAIYLADFLRHFSTSGISAILFEDQDDELVCLNEWGELVQPVINVGKHYQWSTGIRLKSDVAEDVLQSLSSLDFILFADASPSAIHSLWQQGLAHIGGGLNENFWNQGEIFPSSDSRGLAFGTIPAMAQPEKVLERLREFRDADRKEG